MSHTIELPDPLFSEITGYAVRVAVSPMNVIQQDWDEFRQRHPQKAAAPEEAGPLRGPFGDSDDWSPANPPPPLHLGTRRPAWTSRADLVDELYARDNA